MKALFLALFAIVAVAASSFGQKQIYLPWEFVGGPPCPVRDVVLHEGTLYAATDCGLYKRPENGEVWEQQPNTPDSAVTFVGANASALVAVFQRNISYSGYGYSSLEIFNSTDDGASFIRRYSLAHSYWSLFPNGNTTSHIDFEHLYVLGDSTFALASSICNAGCHYPHTFSTDNGQHWVWQDMGGNYPFPYSSLSPYAMQGDTFATFDFDSLKFASTSNLRRLGATKISNPFIGEAVGLTWAHDRLAVGFQNGRYGYTDDFGEHWVKDSVPLTGINDFFYQDNYYYWCTDLGFYRSPTIGGTALNTLYTHFGPLGVISEARRGTNGWYLLASGILLLLPDNVHTAVQVATNGLDYSTGTLSYLPGRFLFENSDGVWWRSSDDGQTWSVEENSTADTQKFINYYVSDTFCLAYADASSSDIGDIGIYRSVDGGANWSHLANSIGWQGHSFFKNRHDGRIYFGRYFTADGGLNWQPIDDYLATDALGDTLLSNTYNAGGFISFDHGHNWMPLIIPGSVGGYNFHLANQALFAFSHALEPTYRSIDFGATWEIVGGGSFGEWTKSQQIGQATWLQSESTLAFIPDANQTYFVVRETDIKNAYVIGIVQKDSTIYTARKRGIWRIPSCYIEHPFSTPPRDTAICQGNIVLFHGDTLRTAGTYLCKIPGLTTFCDSIDVLRLQVNFIKTDWSARICPGDTLLWNGQTYADYGTFIQQFSTSTNCDSIVRLHLSLYSTIAWTSSPLCDEDTLYLNGQAIFMPGQYTFHLPSFAGCDSTLMVNVYDAQDTLEYSRTICAGSTYSLFDHTYTESGEYWFSRITSYNPCPIFFHILLTVLPDEVLVVDTSVVIGTIVYGQVVYSDTIFTVVVAGSGNCDITVHITAHTTVGIDDLDFRQEIRSFPNPFRDQLNLRWPGSASAQVRLYDARGQLWREATLAGPTAVWNTEDLPTGLYRVEITVAGRHYAWKVVKVF